jgi:hypothetical protein
LFFGLQLTLSASSSVVDIIEPRKTDLGSILIFASLKSKSTLVIPNWQTSVSPHNGEISIILFNVFICGSSFKFVEDLNVFPST